MNLNFVAKGYCSFVRDFYYEGRLVWRKDKRYETIVIINEDVYIEHEAKDSDCPFAVEIGNPNLKEFVIYELIPK